MNPAIIKDRSTENCGIFGAPLGAAFLGFSLFFLISFASNAILSNVTLATLGITVSFSVLIVMFTVIFILFVL